MLASYDHFRQLYLYAVVMSNCPVLNEQGQ